MLSEYLMLSFLKVPLSNGSTNCTSTMIPIYRVESSWQDISIDFINVILKAAQSVFVWITWN